MKAALVIGPGVTCDLPRLIGTRLLVQASSGAGKSWLLRRLLEQSHGKVQQIVIDPEGEFASLREKFDYVLAARHGGDTAADPRTAKLLAERLLEVGVSAILDIYELPSHDRVRFVRLFLEALVDAPKHLWHPVLVVLDEAHVFCPESGEAESANAVKGLCSRGRKRGFCAVLATQRLSKLAKDAAAELNNKLIGRTSLDVDMARAGDELGFTKADRLRLRELEDGEFFAFGPALTRVVTKVHVGGVQTQHPKAGGLAAVVPAPSAKIKALLPKLSDLPAEAEAREKSVAELRAELATVKRELTVAKRATPKVETKTVEKSVLKAAHLARLQTLIERTLTASGSLAVVAKTISDALERTSRPIAAVPEIPELYDVAREVSHAAGFPWTDPRTRVTHQAPQKSQQKSEKVPRNGDTAALPPGELAILTAVVQYPGLDRRRLSVLVGYKKSSRDAYIARLSNRGYVTANKELYPTDAGREALGDSYTPLPTGPALVAFWREKLPEGERRIFDLLLTDGQLPRSTIQEATGKKKSSTDAYLQRLKARGLVVDADRGVVRLSL
jgi:DNA-binding IclR family transcriptional regulator